MIEGEEALSAEDIARLAQLHSRNLPLSVLSGMGVLYLKAFYAFVARSDREWLFITRVSGVVQGVGLVSLEPWTISRRLVLGTLVWFSFGVLAGCIRSGNFRKHLMFFLSGPAILRQKEFESPELVHIIVDEGNRDKKIGGTILKRVEIFLRRRSESRYHLKTMKSGPADASKFYIQNGFAKFHEVDFCGQRFSCFEKTL